MILMTIRIVFVSNVLELFKLIFIMNIKIVIVTKMNWKQGKIQFNLNMSSRHGFKKNSYL